MEFRAKEIGQTAEKRVFDIANQLGLPVRKAEPKEDYSQKTDIVIGDKRIQVSCQPKSNAQRKALSKKGILPVVAGNNVSDKKVREQLSKIK
jgi:hypothetical protein